MTDEPTPGAVERRDGMPVLGLGTWENTNSEQCAESVRTALEMGYRHVDTAQAYGNEAAVGEGIHRAAVDREAVFLATKVWIDSLDHGDVIHTTRESLDRLGVASLDLLYVHWPARTYDPAETMGAFAELYDDGVIDRIGISNFQPDGIERAIEACPAPVFANQFECHPLLPNRAVRAACEAHGVEPVAYSPLARGAVLEVPEIRAVAEKHDASPAQVSLVWLREKGLTAIPKATSEEHVRDNWLSPTLELDAEDVERIDGIDRRERKVDPPFAPW